MKNSALKYYINYIRDDERLTSHKLILLRICLSDYDWSKTIALLQATQQNYMVEQWLQVIHWPRQHNILRVNTKNRPRTYRVKFHCVFLFLIKIQKQCFQHLAISVYRRLTLDVIFHKNRVGCSNVFLIVMVADNLHLIETEGHFNSFVRWVEETQGVKGKFKFWTDANEDAAFRFDAIFPAEL